MMMKLKRIDGGMYCLLLTFDPRTDVVNIVDLQASGVGNLVDQSAKDEIRGSKDEKKLEEKSISQTIPGTKDVAHAEPVQVIQKPDDLTKSRTNSKSIEQLQEREEVLKPARDYRPNDLLTRREAAAYLGVSEQTLAIWKCTGRYDLPYLKIGRLVKYEAADLDAFLKRFKHEPLEIQEAPKAYARSSLRSSPKIEF
jgi:excisionase family DNA binding protein